VIRTEGTKGGRKLDPIRQIENHQIEIKKNLQIKVITTTVQFLCKSKRQTPW